MRCFIVLSGLILALASSASGETYVVNPEGTGDFPTIQAALDAVEDGDIIELTDGTFSGDGNRDLDCLGKSITVRSQSGNPDACIIDCEGNEADPHRGFYFPRYYEPPQVLLEGLTITNGYMTGHSPEEYGGGIHCASCLLTLSNCVLSDNYAEIFSGALDCSNSQITLTDVVFRGNVSGSSAGAVRYLSLATSSLTNVTFMDNSTTLRGGAMGIGGGYITFTNVTFVGNTAGRSDGGLSIAQCDEIRLINTTFAENSAPEGAGIGLSPYFAGAVRLENTIVAFGTGGEGVASEEGDDIQLTCCDIYGNEGGDWVGGIASQSGISGNISEDPLFCDPELGDFHLHCESPCAPYSPPNPGCDLIGAWPIGCGGTPVTSTTWGGIKALFRQ